MEWRCSGGSGNKLNAILDVKSMSISSYAMGFFQFDGRVGLGGCGCLCAVCNNWTRFTWRIAFGDEHHGNSTSFSDRSVDLLTVVAYRTFMQDGMRVLHCWVAMERVQNPEKSLQLRKRH